MTKQKFDRKRLGFVLLGIFTLAVIAGAIWWINQAGNRKVVSLYQTQTAGAAWLEQTVQAGKQAMALQETSSAETQEALNALQEATQEALVAQAHEETQRAATRDTPAANARQIVDDKGISMVLVEAGPFEMGMSADDAYKECQKIYSGGTCDRGWFTNMEPVHTVYLDAYYIDQFEVTNASYAQCVAEGVCSLPLYVGLEGQYYGDSRYNNYPVICATWKMANAYCQWRGNGTRLPNEAEWEKAARSTDGRWYPWGSTFNGNIANFCDVNCQGGWKNTGFDDGYADIAPVDAYPEGISSYGAYNMAGNVWEWVNDWYASDYYNSQDEWNNPQGPGTGVKRVLRGGSLFDNGFELLSAYRFWSDPSICDTYIGFRCLRVP